MLLDSCVHAVEEDDEVWEAGNGAKLLGGVGQNPTLPIAAMRVLAALLCSTFNQVLYEERQKQNFENM